MPNTSQYSVGSNPVQLTNASANSYSAVIVTNNGATTVYLGQTGVTAATGWPLSPGQTTQTLNPKVSLYAVAGAPVTQAPSTTLSASAAKGATSLSVTSGTGITNGMSLVIVDGDSTETVIPSAGGGTTTLTVPATQYAHASGVTVSQLLSSTGAAVTVNTN